MIALMQPPDRARPRLRRRRRRVLRRALLPGLRRAVRAAARAHAGSGRHRRRGGQTRPARLRAVEGRQARRARVGDPVGTRAARLAPGVLGDGHRVSRRDVRHPRRRPGPDLPAPRERDRPVARRRLRLRPLLDAQRPRQRGRREDEQVAGQFAARQRGAAPGPAARTAVLPGPGALPVADRILRRRHWRRLPPPTGGSRASWCVPPRWHRRAPPARGRRCRPCRASSPPRWTTTSVSRRLSPSCTTRCGRQQRARRGRRRRGRAAGSARSARCWACSVSTRSPIRGRRCPLPAAPGDLRGVVDALVGVALAQRAAARERKDYAAADAIRDGLHAAGSSWSRTRRMARAGS